MTESELMEAMAAVFAEPDDKRSLAMAIKALPDVVIPCTSPDADPGCQS